MLLSIFNAHFAGAMLQIHYQTRGSASGLPGSCCRKPGPGNRFHGSSGSRFLNLNVKEIFPEWIFRYLRTGSTGKPVMTGGRMQRGAGAAGA